MAGNMTMCGCGGTFQPGNARRDDARCPMSVLPNVISVRRALGRPRPRTDTVRGG
jgi:hypothetical protein